MIEYQGEAYLTVNEIAERFHVSRATCYNNLLQRMQKCYLPGRKHALYKQSDVDQFAEVRIVARNTYRASPASPATVKAGNGVTSTSSLSQHVVDWQGQYSPPPHQMQDA